ncbi:MAG: type II toxin-antitoxin system Phd/YefM family antitoxin [Pseudomonadota bacterium]
MKIPAGQFKARCLKLMEEVRLRRAEIIITKHGKPVAKLVPAEERAAPLLGFLKGTVDIKGDIVKPVGEAWEADG